jgi:hypothetical protein
MRHSLIGLGTGAASRGGRESCANMETARDNANRLRPSFTANRRQIAVRPTGSTKDDLIY